MEPISKWGPWMDLVSIYIIPIGATLGAVSWFYIMKKDDLLAAVNTGSRRRPRRVLVRRRPLCLRAAGRDPVLRGAVHERGVLSIPFRSKPREGTRCVPSRGFLLPRSRMRLRPPSRPEIEIINTYIGSRSKILYILRNDP